MELAFVKKYLPVFIFDVEKIPLWCERYSLISFGLIALRLPEVKKGTFDYYRLLKESEYMYETMFTHNRRYNISVDYRLKCGVSTMHSYISKYPHSKQCNECNKHVSLLIDRYHLQPKYKENEVLELLLSRFGIPFHRS